MGTALFRQEVIEAGRQRLSGTVSASVPPSSRVYTAVALSAALALALLVGFGGYAGGSTVRGVLDYRTGTSRVYASSAGEVKSLAVRVGDRVREGAPLATLATAQGQGGLTVQIAELDRQVSEINRQLGLVGAGASSDRVRQEQLRASLAQTVASIERQRDIARGQITLAQSAVGRSGRLAREGAGTQRQDEEARSDLLARRAAAEALDERLISTRVALAQTVQQLARSTIDAQKTGSELIAQRAALTGQADALRRSDSLVITAPVAGVVADLSVAPGQHVKPQTSLATIIPAGGALEAWLYAPSRAVGFVQVGQPVRLRLEAFPYQKFGATSGTVVAVSPVAVDNAALDPALEINEPVFRIRVRLARDEALQRLRPGMTLSADLLTARRPLWALLLGPIYAAAKR